MAVNDKTLTNDLGQVSDWIEIYNPTTNTVNLNGWYLTDNAANLTKWRFPATNLAPNGFLVVFASGDNRAVPGAPLHTSFSLTGDGEYLGLVKPDGVTVVWQYAPEFPSQVADVSYGLAMQGTATTLVASNATGRALIPSSDIGGDWRTLGYDDLTWLSGPSGVGFDTGTNYDSLIRTDVQTQMLGVNASAYLRFPFVETDPSVFEELKLRLRFDDGFVAYLNDQEILRRNAPPLVVWNSAATGAHGPPPPGSLIESFDPPTTVYTPRQIGAAPGPLVLNTNAGSKGNFLRLINDGVNNNLNSIAFEQTAPGLFETIIADFDFRVSSADDPADGFAFMLIPASAYGTNGPGADVGALAIEEPNIPGVFAVGFDVYPLGEPRNDVSVHWDGSERLNVTMPSASIGLTSGMFHHVRIRLAHVAGGARVTVTFTRNINSTPGPAYIPINNYFVEGLSPYDCRVQFGGRTGGLNMSVDLDNINVQFVPNVGLPVEEFIISNYLPVLEPGTNLLAIHALNRAHNDADFLIAPELVARDLVVFTNTRAFFSAPTPGTANGTGSAGVAGQPQFSIPGGVYTNTLSLQLTTDSPSAVIRYTLNGAEPTSTSTVYTASIVISNSTLVRAKVFIPGFLPGETVTKTYNILASDVFNFNSNLPLVIINSFGRVISENTKIPASTTFIDTAQGRSSLRGIPDFDGRVGIEVRGSSSTGFPKKSYGLELRDDHTNDLAVSLLGLPKESDWVLYAPYTDKTFMNDVLAYDLHERMGHYVVRREFVEVFVDSNGGKLTYNEYAGIYVLLEKIKIDENRVNIAKLEPTDNAEPNVTGGYILKKDRLDANDSPITTTGGGGFPGHQLGIEDPKGIEITAAQRSWINSYLNQFEAALYGPNFKDPVIGYAKYIDVDSFIDQHWIVEYPKNIDGYRLSNFMHKDRGEKLKMDPIWDWNLSFGNANYLEGENTNGYYAPLVGNGDYPWFRRLFQDPDFNQKYIDRWAELRRDIFATSNALARVDEIAALLDEAQARDFKKWPRLGTYIWPNPDSYWRITTYQGTVDWMKNWIRGRGAWIDSQFVAAPAFNQNGGPIEAGFNLIMTAPSSSIYYTLDGSDPRLPGGAVSPGATVYSSPVPLTANKRVFARVKNGAGAWSAPTAATFVVSTPPLVVTEMMYHPQAPAAGSAYVEDDFEYIELKNIGTTTLDLTGIRFTNGIEFNFTGSVVTSLGAGHHVLVVKNLAAFNSRYGSLANIAGTYAGSLDNSGERLALVGALGEPILDFVYDDGWYPITDGHGFSLVIINETAPLNTWNNKSSWRPSGIEEGSPGQIDPPAAVLFPVVINEALAHTVDPFVDSIELHNLLPSPVNIGGWFLSDDVNEPKKFRIPNGRTIPAGGFLVFDERDFNSPNGGGISFALGSDGDEVYLFSGDANTNLTGYFHGFAFGASKNGVAFGRYVTSLGEEHFIAQSNHTPGATNAYPKVGPVVISELMYHPLDLWIEPSYYDSVVDEYIELHNVTDEAVALYDPSYPTNTWRIEEAVEYEFPTNTIIPARGYLLLVSFDPMKSPGQLAAFRSRYGVHTNIAILGPYRGKLDNSGEAVRLFMPGTPESASEPAPYILVDEISYADQFPWPAAADGVGASLQRKNSSAYGNDPINWTAAAPNPGLGFVADVPPTITTQPANQTIVAYQNTTFSVMAEGAPVLGYQWRFNGLNIFGATNSTLSLLNVQAKQQGPYSVVVLNSAGFVESTNVVLTVLIPAMITAQPKNQSVRPGANVTNSVSATSTTPPINYQWRFNGTNILGATNSTHIITNIQAYQSGKYTVVVTDGIGSVASTNALIVVLVNPFIVEQPQSQTVVERENVTFTVRVLGTSPFGYRWRRGATTIVAFGQGTSSFTITNVQMSDTNLYSVVITNAANLSPGLLSDNAVLTVLADHDGDRIPDIWEATHGLNTNSVSDGVLDTDGDGMTNWQEYQAGTDPIEAGSVLRIDRVVMVGEELRVGFRGVSGKTYRLERGDSVEADIWTNVVDVKVGTVLEVELIDPEAATRTSQLYRVRVMP